MAVNGIEMESGQTWITHGGQEVVLHRRDPLDVPDGDPWPWIAIGGDCYSDEGIRFWNDDHGPFTNAGLNLARPLFPIEMIEVGQPAEPTDQVKLSNPKDAIGDAKVPLWLCSPIAKAHWALAQFAGMLKYGAWNWRAAGVRKSVYLSAMERHLDAFKSGETFDPVDGTHHLGNIMACAAILLDAAAAGKITDDRPPMVGIRETYEQVQKQMAVLRTQYVDKVPKHWTIADEVST